MKIRHKTVLAIVAVCSCICMFCIGFANWSMGTPSSTVTGTISAEDVKNYIEFVSVSGLEYAPDGFIDSNGDTSYAATLIVTYRFYRGRIYQALTNPTATVSITLQYADTSEQVKDNIFAEGTNFVKAEVASGTALNPNSTVNGTACILTFSLNLAAASEESYTEITATFNFNLGEETNYQKYIYGDGGKKFPGFKIMASITGVDG